MHSDPSSPTPAVSVVMPAYNAAATIEGSVGSVLAQTFADFEFLIVDDGSTDATRAIVSAIPDQRIALIETKHHGVSAARNVGLARARSPIVAFIDADDRWAENKLAACTEALESSPEAALVYSWVDRIEVGGSHSAAARNAPSGNLRERLLTAHLATTASNLMVRRQPALEIGGFNESLSFAEDWDFTMRLAERYDFVGIEEVLVLYVQHGANSTRDLRSLHKHYRAAARSWNQNEPRRRIRFQRRANQSRYMATQAAEVATTLRQRLAGIGHLATYGFCTLALTRRGGQMPDTAFLRNCGRALVRPSIEPDGPAAELAERGLVRDCRALADPSILSDLIADEPTFAAASIEIAATGDARVPYLITEAIARVAFDSNLAAFVGELLGGDPWVMWGANIRSGIPNRADLWHVDVESRHWDNVTVVLGIAGCDETNSTRYIPYSHQIDAGPPPDLACADSAEAVAAAKWRNPRCTSISGFSGFGNGRFYAFDANGWHAGDPEVGRDRILLFTHFHRAKDQRIPNMRDYKKGSWFSAPAPYLSSFDWPDRTVAPSVSPRRHPEVNAGLAIPPSRPV